MTVEVYLLQSSAALNGTYSYQVPEAMVDQMAPGVFVSLPFGRNNTEKRGVVWHVYPERPEGKEGPYRLKEINRLEGDLIPLTEKEMKLAEKMQRLYLCSMGDCVRCLMPPEGGRGRRCNITALCFPVSQADQVIAGENFRNIAQIKVLEYLRDCGGRAPSRELLRSAGCTASVLRTLEKHGYVTTVKGLVQTVSPEDAETVPPYPSQPLTQQQRQAYETVAAVLDRQGFQEILLHGVTGSGKTEIYLQLIEKVLNCGGNSIVLVPEISLTPQMSARFTGRFGSRVAVLHSRLSDGARHREWDRIRSGEVSVVLGARSAVFAPFSHTQLIILDEEHELTYKSEEQQPRYHAREIAVLRGRLDGGTVLLGSATPSVETFCRAKRGEILYVPLTERVNRRPLPQVKLVDMREEFYAVFR